MVFVEILWKSQGGEEGRDLKSAGFTPVSHIVWHKSYVSSARFFPYCHEPAYVLARGRPSLPAEPLSPVMFPSENSSYCGHRRGL